MEVLAQPKRNLKRFFVSKVNNGIVTNIWTWRSFCEATSIHGLVYIFSKNNIHRFWKCSWIMIWLSMFCLTVLACWNSTVKYLEYKVKTDMSYQNVNELPFPAVTFCNLNQLKRSMFGSSPQLEILVKHFLSFTVKDSATLLHEEAKERKYCSSNITTQFTERSVPEILELGFINVVEQTMEGYQDLVKKCWWNAEEEACDNAFANHQTDLGWCFTYNPYKSLVLEGRIKNGTNRDDFADHIVNVIGPNSGMKILLNTNQSEYCGNVRPYIGAGFRVMIHDQRMMNPFFEIIPVVAPVMLSPGMNMQIRLQPVTFTRKTEHLGLCHSPQYAGFNESVYLKTLCFLLCHSKLTYKQCQCFANWVEGNELFFSTNLNLPLNVVKQNLCNNLPGISCTLDIMKLFLTQSQELCPYCTIDPCSETKYEQSISTSYFPSKASGNNTGFEYELHNLNVIESQDFTFIDLIIYYGGIMGLFLGMSFLSIWEPINQILISIQMMLRNFHNSKTTVHQIIVQRAKPKASHIVNQEGRIIL